MSAGASKNVPAFPSNALAAVFPFPCHDPAVPTIAPLSRVDPAGTGSGVTAYNCRPSSVSNVAGRP